MEYKYEIHCHTGETSRCATAPASEAVRTYRELGYDGIVITDHYSPQTFLDRHIYAPQKETDFYLKGYHAALEAAGNDFTVLLGMELRFYGNTNDYLVYGMTENFIREHGNIMTYYPRYFHKLAKENGMLFLQAHPFRPFIFRTNPKYLDGCEIFNGKDRFKNTNEQAEAWAEENNMKIRTGGGDFHHVNNENSRSGIITEERIRTNDDLVRILKSGNFKIIKELQKL